MAWTSKEDAGDIAAATWTAVLGSNGYWEYDATPAVPTVGTPEHYLWLKQTDGIREISGTTTNAVYTKCRRVGTTDRTQGELNKTFWDGQV